MNSHVAQRSESLRQKLDALYAPIASEMREVEELLQSELKSDNAYVDELVKYGFRISGKKLRPALVLLTAKAAGQATRDHLVLAAVLEMIHTATLVHDDVLDEAGMRRHLVTVNARWNNESSVLLGDYLFTHAFYLASTLDSTFACRTIGKATNIVCAGELHQVHQRGNYGLSEAEYLEIIDAKTAELTECCCRLGAHYAGCEPELVERWSRFGRNLGIAFQIADDLLDLFGDQSETGKSLGTDLEKAKATLPLIHLLRSASPEERTQILELLEGDAPSRRADLQPWLARYGSIEYAQEQARAYAQAALQELEDLPPSPSLTVLRMLAEFVVSRQN